MTVACLGCGDLVRIANLQSRIVGSAAVRLEPGILLTLAAEWTLVGAGVQRLPALPAEARDGGFARAEPGLDSVGIVAGTARGGIGFPYRLWRTPRGGGRSRGQYVAE